MLFNTLSSLHCTAPHFTVLYCTALHCTALHDTARQCTALNCTALNSTKLHCTKLNLYSFCDGVLHFIYWSKARKYLFLKKTDSGPREVIIYCICNVVRPLPGNFWRIIRPSQNDWLATRRRGSQRLSTPVLRFSTLWSRTAPRSHPGWNTRSVGFEYWGMNVSLYLRLILSQNYAFDFEWCDLNNLWISSAF